MVPTTDMVGHSRLLLEIACQPYADAGRQIHRKVPLSLLDIVNHAHHCNGGSCGIALPSGNHRVLPRQLGM
jgi:hypothetical protein